ncbi:HNH endonuclease family protein [Streptomyces sp. NPDC053427]|uniref:HNH endonuclease family protein n=1 Tax=Streptomyces sp. NPDC053427 TaxID=3365701 RepID=UPI0037D54976
MIRTRAQRLVSVVALALAAVLGPVAATPVAAAPAEMPEPPSAEVARTELADLTVEAPHSMEGYSRAKFPHWIQQGNSCDTREVVLKRDGENVAQDAQCRAVSGTWRSLYDDKTLTAASQVDIDHMVPLANAWRSGADSWTTARRTEFANDLLHSQLIAVSAGSNRSKGDQSPDQWSPPSRGYWCTYARAWTDVKHLYQLSVTQPEADQLVTMLDTCA